VSDDKIADPDVQLVIGDLWLDNRWGWLKPALSSIAALLEKREPAMKASAAGRNIEASEIYLQDASDAG